MPDLVLRGWAWMTAAVAVALAVSVHESFSQQQMDVPSFPAVVNPRLDKITVATAGPLTISATEFLLNYNLGPAFVKRSTDSRRRSLDFMINEKLLALDARERGMNSWPDVQRQTEEIAADLATEELYRRDVLGRAHITDREVAHGSEMDRIHLNVRWIFAATSEEIQNHLHSLNTGIPFDSLFRNQLQSGVTVEDRSMESTRFRLQMQNPVFAAVIDTLTSGRVSLPVHGPDGWYLVQVADRWTNPIMTGTEEAKRQQNVRDVLLQRVADSLSDAYVRRLMEGRALTIVRGSFNAVSAYAGSKFLSRKLFDEWKLGDRPGVRALPERASLDSTASDTLVQMNNGAVTIREFLEWCRMREPYIKVSRTSLPAFFSSVEQLIWRMVRDRLLTNRAYELGFQKRESVKRQTQWWNQKMLYLANKNRISDSITDSLPILRKFYDDNRKYFVDERGKELSFDQARDDVWRRYHADELRKKLLHEILRLKRTYNVRVDAKALESLTVDAENDPRAIDVYPAKTGGIYPRQAFPSIDYDWQTWN